MLLQSPSSSERRTLPNDLPGPGPSSHARRRAFQKRSSSSPQESGLQTSCSLPETPIFARGCDIPRTPHRRAPDVPAGGSGASAGGSASMRASSSTTASASGASSRPSGLQTSSYHRKMGPGPGGMAHGLGTGVSLDSGGLGQALVGAELLRLTGGPGRGWYPRHRATRPASIEHLDRVHLDRVAPQHSPSAGLWDARDARKPMTLPPNITPKFFHRSPRDALRRVTSLLIRGKGRLPQKELYCTHTQVRKYRTVVVV
ncbi:Secernin-2 [Frankliniella fusca]|uniref:Secernin-2 n=1 Tax=Frankliniella fusca TaxID=407009 RepID=A0AAE1LQJ9_9NEOP|nr:Secernin-2 [Frankliniella fusca]